VLEAAPYRDQRLVLPISGTISASATASRCDRWPRIKTSGQTLRCRPGDSSSAGWTAVDVDDLRFFNVGFTARDVLESRAARFDSKRLHANAGLRKLDSRGTSPTPASSPSPVQQPKTSVFVPGTMGQALELQGQSAASSFRPRASVLAVPEHSFHAWTQITTTRRPTR